MSHIPCTRAAAVPDPEVSHHRKSGAVGFLQDTGVGRRRFTIGLGSTSFALVSVAAALWPGQGMDRFSSRRLTMTAGSRALCSRGPCTRDVYGSGLGWLTASVAVGHHSYSGGLLPLLREDKDVALSHQKYPAGSQWGCILCMSPIAAGPSGPLEAGACACRGQPCVSRI